MRTWLLVGYATTLAGCDLVFSLPERPDPDAMACTPRTSVAPAADHVTISSDPGFDTDPTYVRIDGGPTRALWKFALPGEVTGHAIVALRLNLPYLTIHPKCDSSSNCGGSCLPLERPGVIDAFSVDLDWDQGSDWYCRHAFGPCATWGQDGAAGASRGPMLGIADHSPGTTTVISLDPSAAFVQQTDGHIAVVVQAHEETGTGAAASITGISPNGNCAGVLPVQLDFDYCP